MESRPIEYFCVLCYLLSRILVLCACACMGLFVFLCPVFSLSLSRSLSVSPAFFLVQQLVFLRGPVPYHPRLGLCLFRHGGFHELLAFFFFSLFPLEFLFLLEPPLFFLQPLVAGLLGGPVDTPELIQLLPEGLAKIDVVPVLLEGPFEPGQIPQGLQLPGPLGPGDRVEFFLVFLDPFLLLECLLVFLQELVADQALDGLVVAGVSARVQRAYLPELGSDVVVVCLQR
mmetsp:Transcript_7269/g.14931  ORF Transcript_7269/g.14931 Transcript_7269/m.14931 type:complete len:229 (-) Transcript_7269:1234-1920(-)